MKEKMARILVTVSDEAWEENLEEALSALRTLRQKDSAEGGES